MLFNEGGFSLFSLPSASFLIKSFLILFLVFYAFFAFIMFRQVQIMGRALPTSVLPFLKFIAIIHLGVSIALLFLSVGLF